MSILRKLNIGSRRTPANNDEISLLAVKALYDAAFEERAAALKAIKRYKAQMRAAQTLDRSWRRQLEAKRVPGLAATSRLEA